MVEKIVGKQKEVLLVGGSYDGHVLSVSDGRSYIKMPEKFKASTASINRKKQRPE